MHPRSQEQPICAQINLPKKAQEAILEAQNLAQEFNHPTVIIDPKNWIEC